MSLFSAMMASVSGMQGQATLLSTISDNISNSSTTGYKQANTAFEDMLSQVSKTSYTAGGVGTTINYGISDQGDLESATSATDLAISGNGFFVVQDASGNTYLTRAGDFSPNVDGNLVNSEGYTLMGYPDTDGAATLPGSVGQLTPITISTAGLSATPSTTGTLTANMDSSSSVVAAADLPSAGGTTYTSTTTVTAYDDLGTPVTMNIYFTNMGVDGGTGNDEWEVDVYDNATPSTATPANTLLSTDLEFSPTSGDLVSGSPLSIAVPGGQTLNLDMANTTQLDSTFGVTANTVNGNAPASYSSLAIGTDGTVSEVFSNGTTTPIAKIPLATVASVNSLTPHSGQTYSANPESGNIILGNANSAGFGSINSNELESSTVDLATQLTNMVVAQNAYSANSKAFQTGSDMLSTLINMLK
jgi:flagellar hook protein FlgE